MLIVLEKMSLVLQHALDFEEVYFQNKFKDYSIVIFIFEFLSSSLNLYIILQNVKNKFFLIIDFFFYFKMHRVLLFDTVFRNFKRKCGF